MIGLRPQYIKKKVSTAKKIKFFGATLLGTNIGILLQQKVFQVLPLGIGWTILSTSPLISLLFSKAEGEQLNFKIVILTITTISGVAITCL